MKLTPRDRDGNGGDVVEEEGKAFGDECDILAKEFEVGFAQFGEYSDYNLIWESKKMIFFLFL